MDSDIVVTEADEETLALALRRFNKRLAAKGGMGVDTLTLPHLFIPGAVALEHLADVGIYSSLLQASPQGLVAVLQRHERVRVGDLIKVFNHRPDQAPVAIQQTPVATEQEGGDIALYLPAEQVVPGISELYCEVTRNNEQELVGRSAPLTLLCKPTLPGGVDPTPETSWHGGLAAPELKSSVGAGAVAVVRVLPWLFMQAGGLLQLAWGNQLLGYRFTDEEVGRALEIEVPDACIVAAGCASLVPVRYRIIDVVGDPSQKWSPVTWVAVPPKMVREQGPANLCDPPRLHGPIEAQEIDLVAGAVQVLVWATAQQMAIGDRVRLQANGIGFSGQAASLNLEQVVDETAKGLYFQLPDDWLAQLAGGWLSLAYDVLRGGEVVAVSSTRYLEVPGIVSGLAYPDPGPVSDGCIVSMASSLAVTVRDRSLAYGQRVTLCWHGLSVAGVPYVWEVTRTVSRSAAEKGCQVFLVAREHLQAIAQGSLQLHYRIATPGPAAARHSPRLWLGMGALQPTLPPAWVEGRDELGDVRVDANQDVAVQLDYSEAEPDDGIEAYLQVTDTGDHFSLAGSGNRWRIAPEVANTVLEREAALYYRVARPADQRVRLSVRLALTLTAGLPLRLGEPQVMEVLGDGSLDPSKSPPQGITVRAGHQAEGLRPGDSLTLHVRGGKPYDSQPQRYDGQQPLSFLVAARLLTDSLGAELTFYYSVLRGGREIGRSPVASHAVRYYLSVDSSLMKLDGIAVKHLARGEPLNESIGNSAVRRAVGGLPPYRYVSSKPAVASVIEGKVVGESNGTAVITISDSLGTQVRFTVQVTHVYRLEIRTVATDLAGALAWCRACGGTNFSHAAYIDYRHRYGPLVNYLGQGYTWMCEPAAQYTGYKQAAALRKSDGAIMMPAISSKYAAVCMVPHSLA